MLAKEPDTLVKPLLLVASELTIRIGHTKPHNGDSDTTLSAVQARYQRLAWQQPA